MRDIGRTSWRTLGVAAALALGLATAVLTVPSASAASAGGRGGAGQIFPRITFYFGLRRPEARARQAFFAVQQPGSASYRRFLTPRQVAARYGASPGVRAQFVRAIRRYGFSVRIDPSGVFARVTSPVTLFQRVFKVRITQGMGDDPPVRTYSTTARLRLPSDLRPLVQDVVTSYLRQVRVTASRARGCPHSLRGRRRGRGSESPGAHRDLDRRLRAGGGDRRVQLRAGPRRLRDRPARDRRRRLDRDPRSDRGPIGARHRRQRPLLRLSEAQVTHAPH